MIKIREASKEDLSSIYEIELVSFKKDAYPLFYLKALLSSSRNLFLLAEEGGEILGYIVASIEKGEGHLISIAVHPKFRQRGIGSMLLRELLNKLKKNSISRVWLEVRESNVEACKLYEKFSFKLKGRIPGYYNDGETALVYFLEMKEGKCFS